MAGPTAARRRGLGAAAAAAFAVVACWAGALGFVGRAPQTPRVERSPISLRAERRSSTDNFIDKAFTVMADLVVAGMPLSQQEKDAYQYYRDGMAAQTSGDYSTALRAYAESLKLEEDPIDRSYIFYNLGLIFGNNGEYIKAVKYYHLAIDQNKQICQAYNNIAVIYHDQGTRAERSGNIEKANLLYDKAAQYWNQAIKIAPTNYLEAYNWLKNTGKLATALDNKIMGIF